MSDWSPDITKLRALDDAEWTLVERTYCGRLLAYAQRRTGDVQAAEDVLQETLLGAVRGIQDYDPRYTFEQYLFGICKNRTIDSLRRKRLHAFGRGDDGDNSSALVFEDLVASSETPSAIVRARELSTRAAELLADTLRDWVEETWTENEFERLCVIEALFSGGWRNRDTWQRFDLRDETAVAGIKFRALKRLRQLAALRGSGSDLLHWLELASDAESGRGLEVDVGEVWRRDRVSCPARQWLARLVAGTLEPGPERFVRFHVEELHCSWCQANLDDLARENRRETVEPVLERVHASTLHALRSRAVPPEKP